MLRLGPRPFPRPHPDLSLLTMAGGTGGFWTLWGSGIGLIDLFFRHAPQYAPPPQWGLSVHLDPNRRPPPIVFTADLGFFDPCVYTSARTSNQFAPPLARLATSIALPASFIHLG